METAQNNARVQKSLILWRGVCGRCPNCGTGRLFKSYLKQNDSCSVCGQDFKTFRADDGPAWLTILLTGHIMVPTVIYVSMHNPWPEGVTFALMVILTIIVALVLLPLTKGAFISILWLLARKKAIPLKS